MSKPIRTDIDHLDEGWDAPVNDNFAQLYDAPMPVFEDVATSLAELETNFPAASFDGCIVWFPDSALAVLVLARSNGTAWAIIGGNQGADPTDFGGSTGVTVGDDNFVVIPAPADTPASADALRDDLETNVLPIIRDNQERIKAKMNLLLVALRNAGIIG